MNRKPLVKIFLSLSICLILGSSSFAQTTVNFSCGAPTNWTVPPCVTSITINMSGGQGGGINGGMGVTLTGSMAVTPGQVLQISVGCQPGGVAGGTGGGGAGQTAGGAGNSSFGGGGATSISIGGVPMAVAAGGGGMGGGDTDAQGGDAGCPNGANGISPFGQGGYGATTTAGGAGGPPWISSGNPGTAGSFGQGGVGGSDPCYNLGPGGGGGGGYYGGGGGGSDCFSSSPLGGGGGGGGSSLVPGGVTCATGHAGNGALSITYTGGTATATAANTGPYCAGQTIQLNSTGGGTYSWSGPGGYTSASQNPTIGSSTTAMSGVYTVTVNAGGCVATATTSVTVNPAPAITVNSATICAGNSTTLTAAGGTTYTWSPGTGLSSANGSPVTANPTTTTVYTITSSNTGCVSTTTSTVTVNPLPTINVTNGTVCNGNSVTLTAIGASTYAWSPGTGLSSTSGSSVTANPPSTTQYTITGTDANGCTSTGTTTVTVISTPTVTATSGTICAGGNTTLTASGATTYVWSPATGLSSTNGTSVTASPATTTVYTITGTAGTCTAVGTSTVTVNPLPVVVAGSNSPLCVNQNLNLTSGGGTGYSWNGPNSFSSTQQNPSVNGVTTSATGVYTVTVTDVNTCVNTGTVSVTVNSLPVVGVTGATVCVGATINISSNGGVTYSWSGPGSYSSNQQNPSIPNATASMAGNYVVTVTDVNGCSSGNVASVAVNPSLLISASNNGPLCQNATLNLTSSTGVSWVWGGPNNFSSFTQNGSINNIQVSASGVYTVTGTDANGCQGTATTTVVINPLPTITANSATICVTQQTASLTAGGGVTYVWTPAATLSSSNGNSVTGNPTVTTTYTITGTDANGCVNIGTTAITVNPLPTVTVTSPTICIGNSSSVTAAGALNYSWTPSTGLSSTSGSQVTANPTSTSSYSVTGTDANGCYSSASNTVTVNSLPVVSATSGTICTGQSTAVLSASGANTYAWSPVTGLSSSVGSSVTANPTSTSTYVVTGTDVNGCKNTYTTTVNVNPTPIISVSPTVSSGCLPVCVSLSNTTTATGNYNWNFGDGSVSSASAPSHCYTIAGAFTATLTLTDNNGCKSTATSIVNVYPVPVADFSYSPLPTTTLDPLIHFADGSTNATIAGWSWSFGDSQNSTSTTQNPSFNYVDAGSYPTTLVVVSDFGCVDSITKTVVIDQDFMIYIPNAFSPNADNVNDTFAARGEGIKEFKMYIFDRWGTLVYFTDNIDKGWDGSIRNSGSDIVVEDVYIWKIELKNFKGEPKQLKGTVSVVK